MQQQSKIEKVIQLRENGDLKFLLDIGFLSWKVYFYIDVYQTYDILIKTGATKMEAVHETALKFNVDITTIYRVLKKLSYEDSNSNPNDSGEGEVSEQCT